MCQSLDSISSNPDTVNLYPKITPTVSIGRNVTGAFCSGTNVTFTANATNGGNAPSFSWWLNGNRLASVTGLTYTTDSLKNTDKVTVRLYSTAHCLTSDSATSNTDTVIVNCRVIPSVSITSSVTADTIGNASTQTLTATAINGGANTLFQCYRNGTLIAGAISAAYHQLVSLATIRSR